MEGGYSARTGPEAVLLGVTGVAPEGLDGMLAENERTNEEQSNGANRLVEAGGRIDECYLIS